MSEKIIVVGSGPAGVACARALIERGCDVTLVDSGIGLEPERQQALERLRNAAPEDWDRAAKNLLVGETQSNFGGIPIKLAYGSDFPYREVAQVTPIESERVTTFASLAKGGLSNVWGAAVLPYRADDIEDWPITLDDLAPAYRAIFKTMPLAARRDDLERLFPLYTDANQPLALSGQATRLLARMEDNRLALERQGFVFGASRLAVRAKGGPACVYCGLCMYGCPYALIYNSAEAINPIKYVNKVLVERVAETQAGVILYARNLRDGSMLEFEADRVYLGCGVFQTARIMLKSLGADDRALVVRDSQYFLLPTFAINSTSDVTREKLHTLSQVFIEVSDRKIGKYPSHLQVYTYNDLYLKAIRNKLGALAPLLQGASRSILNRLMVIQGYLHSKVSGTATVRLQGEKLKVTGGDTGEAARRVKAVVKKLSRNATNLGFMPILPALKIGNIGQGAHVGGTFPMRTRPGHFETDPLGRPGGFTRVHLVDASVLPSIPATTITLTVMANAYRIGSQNV